MDQLLNDADVRVLEHEQLRRLDVEQACGCEVTLGIRLAPGDVVLRDDQRDRLADAGPVDDDAVLLCFQRPPLEEARRRRPALRTMQHVGFGVSIRRAAGAWAAGFRDDRVTQPDLLAAQRLGLETAVYTVNNEARMLELQELGVTGIFTDRPDRALAALGRRPAG